MRKHAGHCPIIGKRNITGSVFEFTFAAPEIAAVAQPGQFVQIRTSDNYDPLWPRPFSIYTTDRQRGEFSIIFKIFGGGTSRLAARSQGDILHVHGPLGNGFAALEKDRKVIMAAGGVGLPPLYWLAKESIASGYSPADIIFISGARTKQDHFDDERLLNLGMDLRICTDDGSKGDKGTSVDLLVRSIGGDKDRVVYACGPTAMLEKIDDILRGENMRGFLSLETLMPCGMGICSGCAVKTKPGPDRGQTDDKRDYHLKRVCVDGPVFKAGEVIWH